MTLVSLLLVLTSAFVHASWNMLGRRSRPVGAYYLVASLVGVLVLAPFVIVWRDVVALMPAATWWRLPLAGLFQTLYFTGLAGAYRSNDMAVAYPVARALPVLLVPAVAHLLGQGDPVTALGLAGMIAVTFGILVLPQPSFRRFAWRSFGGGWLLYAMLAGVGTTGYSIVDDGALAAFRSAVGSAGGSVRAPLVYAMFESLASAIGLTGLAILAGGAGKIARDLRSIRVKEALVSGVAIVAAYALVLVAYGYARNVAYVVAFRQVSLPIGVFMAIAILKERVNGPRVVGTAVLLAGLVMVTLG